MPEPAHFFTDTKKELETYLENRVLLLKMQAADKAARLVANGVVVMLLGLLAFCILFFLSMMAGYYFADLTSNLEIGFAIVAGFYFLIFLIFLGCRKKMTKSISDRVIHILFKDDE